MRILAINPNTTADVTRRFVDEARREAPDGTTIEGVTGTFGAAIVSTRAEAAIAAHAVLDLLATHGTGYDAAILAISFDTGLAAARDAMPYPVVGLTEATLLAACEEAERIGLVTFGAQSLPLYRDLVATYGLAERVVGIEVVAVDTAAGYLAPETRDAPGDRDAAILAAVARLAAAGAGAAAICGAAIVGTARRLREAAPILLHDGAAPSVALVLRRVAEFRPAPPPRPLGGTVGLSPALARLLAGDGPAPRGTA